MVRLAVQLESGEDVHIFSDVPTGGPQFNTFVVDLQRSVAVAKGLETARKELDEFRKELRGEGS